MRFTTKKFKQLLALANLKGSDPEGKPTTLCDKFYVDTSLGSANISALSKTQALYMNISMECESGEISRIPIDVDEYMEKLERFNDADLIYAKIEGNTTIIGREKPAKKFTTNNPTEPLLSYYDPAKMVFSASAAPVGIKLNSDLYVTHIKTTAESMLDVIEDAKPFYKKVSDITFPLTINNDSVRIDIGNKTVGSVESELQVNSIETPVQKKAVFGLGIHNIFKVLSGPVDLYFGDFTNSKGKNASLVVIWESGVFKVKYMLKGFNL